MEIDSNKTADCVALQEEYEKVLHRVVQMRKTYPAACASYLTGCLRVDADLKMKAEVIPNEKLKDTLSPKYIDNASLDKLNLTVRLEPFIYKGEDLNKQIPDIRTVLNQIRAAKHKNVQQ